MRKKERGFDGSQLISELRGGVGRVGCRYGAAEAVGGPDCDRVVDVVGGEDARCAGIKLAPVDHWTRGVILKLMIAHQRPRSQSRIFGIARSRDRTYGCVAANN